MNKFLFFLFVLFTSCQGVNSQDAIFGDIELVLPEKIVFYDDQITDSIQVGAVSRVEFKSKQELQPQQSEVVIFRAKRGLDFIHYQIRNTELSDIERQFMERYTPKVDSIILFSEYRFIGDANSMKSKRLDMSFSFMVAPKSKQN